MITGIMIGFLLALVVMAGGFLCFFARSRYPRRTRTGAEKMHERTSEIKV
jgi:hypothetical protein